MNRPAQTPAAKTINMAVFQQVATEVYTVAVVGFNQTERIVLGSIFGLSARRNPSFVAFTPKPDTSPDLFLIDADDRRCPDFLRAVTAKSKAPIILVGDSDHGTRHFVLPRPLRHGAALSVLAQAMRERYRPAPDESTAVPKPAVQVPVAAAPSAQQAPVQHPASTSTDRVLVVDDSLAVLSC